MTTWRRREDDVTSLVASLVASLAVLAPLVASIPPPPSSPSSPSSSSSFPSSDFVFSAIGKDPMPRKSIALPLRHKDDDAVFIACCCPCCCWCWCWLCWLPMFCCLATGHTRLTAHPFDRLPLASHVHSATGRTCWLTAGSKADCCNADDMGH